MYKPIPSKLRLPARGDPPREERQGRRWVRVQGQGEGKRNPSASKKMEEKYIYKVGSVTVRRSTSTNGNRKEKAERVVEEEYGVGRARQAKRMGVQKQDCLQLGCNSRESYKALEKQPPTAPNAPRLRLLRARSNDSLGRALAERGKQEENEIKLKSLRDRNTYLKQLHTQSLTKIEELSSVQAEEQTNFEGEQRVYERQIEMLRGRVDRNKVDIGHLFSFESFDPATLVVRPIIEVEQQSSIMRSHYNTSNSKRNSVNCEYGLQERHNKKIPTETTALSSQNYRDAADLF